MKVKFFFFIPMVFFAFSSCSEDETVLKDARVSEDVKAYEIFSDFKTNAVSARLKYGHKQIAVRGIVAKIEPYGDGSMVLINDGDPENIGVKCYFNTDQTKSVAQLHPGDGIKIKGVGSDDLYVDYEMHSCVIAPLGEK